MAVLKKKVPTKAAAPVKKAVPTNAVARKAVPTKAVAKKAVPARAVAKKAVPTKQAAGRRPADDGSDDEPVQRAGKRSSKSAVTSGWGGAEQIASELGTYAKNWTPDEGKSYIVRFLGNAPFANFGQHWIRTGDSKRSYVCLGSKVCPLCAVGDKPSGKYNFNIAVLNPGEEPMLWSFGVGITVFNKIKAIHNDARKGPIDKKYYEVVRTSTGTGKGKKYDTAISWVKERDLPDFEVEPLTDEQLEDLMSGLYTMETIDQEKKSFAELEEIARELTGGAGTYDEDE